MYLDTDSSIHLPGLCFIGVSIRIQVVPTALAVLVAEQALLRRFWGKCGPHACALLRHLWCGWGSYLPGGSRLVARGLPAIQIGNLKSWIWIKKKLEQFRFITSKSKWIKWIKFGLNWSILIVQYGHAICQNLCEDYAVLMRPHFVL